MKIRRGRENVEIPTGVKDEEGKPVWIKACEVMSYLDAEFFSALDIYLTSEILECLPYDGGWAEQPYPIVVALTTLKMEQKAMEAEARGNNT